MASSLNITIEQLTEAVNVAINPSALQGDRDRAYRICESFKESSTMCIPYGIKLAFIQNPPNIRHFGLQLLEHSVKFQWNTISVDDKVLVKDTVMRMMSSGTNHILKEKIYIKDGLAKVVVEMAKREWPQQWPTFMNELHSLCKEGETQTELVMFILLRLVEDAVGSQNIPQQRRKEISQALNAEMESLFTFFRELLKHYTDRFQLKKSEGSLEEAQAACKVAENVLLTLSGFVEWTPSQHVFKDNNALLRMLYLFLSEPGLRLRAAECLQIIVHWKGKLEDRVPLLILLSQDAISTIGSAARDVSLPNADEGSYVFLKLLCQILTGLLGQLCAIWGADVPGFEVPPNLELSLQTLWAFTDHPSVHVCHMTLTTWLALLRHQYFIQHPSLTSILPALLQIFTKTLQKVGMPSRSDYPSCHFSKMDFDSDDEFLQFFAIHRSHQVDVIRKISTHSPSLAFDVVSKWLIQLLQSPLQLEAGHTMCTHHSPSWHQWDALTSFMDAVMGKVLVIDDSLNLKALDLLHSALDADIKDPLILSCVLTCVSALFPSLKKDMQQVKKVLDKLFAAAVYSLPGQTKKTRTRPVQNVRRHACCGLVRMCLDHPELMVPFFDEIHNKTREVMRDPEQLTKLERVNLYETLILISNEFKDFDRQSTLIKEVLEPVSSVWIAQSTKQMIFPAEAFLHHVGLDEFPTSPSQEEALGANRAHITTCLTHILAVMKRSCVPKDMQEAKDGGFVKAYLADGRPIVTNPSAPHVTPLLHHVLELSWTLNTIWTPEVQAKVCPEYKKAFEISEMERNAILGVSPSLSDVYELPANRPMAEKTQSFLHSIHDQLCHIFATACQSFGYEFYSPEGIGLKMRETLFSNIEFLPNFKLRNIIRVVLKHLVQYCPPDCYTSLLIPILKKMCSLLLDRLSGEWSRQQGEAEEGNNQEEAEEILADHLLRLITRDYLDLLRLILVRRDSSEVTDNKMDMEEDEDAKNYENKSEADQMGMLGLCAMQDEELCQSIIFCVYSAMSWNDTLASIRSANLAGILLPQIFEKPLLPQAAAQLFTAVLKGLNVHGQHDAGKSSLLIRSLQHYELLRPKFKCVEDVLCSIPDVSAKDVDVFTKRFICKGPTAKPLPEKKKKEAFKKLVSGVIAKPVGQMFKREVHIQNLPPLYRPPKLKAAPVDSLSASSEDQVLVALFGTE
ncbi:Exportin-5 [Holothuria leucospilota]|uniref:Exportin-5 n=1 Tax=Holothuria leucospilota TaxID=206669 RepID=A0A9Q1HDZ2_HOLLE|nr:Exportin-5 [Holothuria leucospilota]